MTQLCMFYTTINLFEQPASSISSYQAHFLWATDWFLNPVYYNAHYLSSKESSKQAFKKIKCTDILAMPMANQEFGSLKTRKAMFNFIPKYCVKSVFRTVYTVQISTVQCGTVQFCRGFLPNVNTVA